MHTDWKEFLQSYPPSRLTNTTLRKNPIICSLADAGLLRVSGLEAKKLLQGQLTYDLEQVTPTNGSLAALCNSQGRIVSLFYLLLLKDAYYLVMPSSMLDLTIATLKKYAVFYKVELTDMSEELVLIGLGGIEAPELNEDDATIYHSAMVKLPSNEPRYLMLADLTTIKQTWQTLSKDAQPIDVQQWKYLNIMDEIPAIYPETSEKFLPHEINLDKLNAISFDKGCYTGQEIIARMHYRGKLKNHLYQAEIISHTAPAPGNDMRSIQGQDIQALGIVVDAYRLEPNHYLCLVMTDEANAKDDHLFLDHDYKAFFQFLL